MFKKTLSTSHLWQHFSILNRVTGPYWANSSLFALNYACFHRAPDSMNIDNSKIFISSPKTVELTIIRIRF